MPTQMRCADGVYVTTGFPPRSQRSSSRCSNGSKTQGLLEEFPRQCMLDLAIERGGAPSIAEMATRPSRS